MTERREAADAQGGEDGADHRRDVLTSADGKFLIGLPNVGTDRLPTGAFERSGDRVRSKASNVVCSWKG